MGTSKGYIAPTTIEWAQAKRAVTSLIKELSHDNISKASSKYAGAMKSDGFAKSTMPKAVSGILGLSRNIRINGIEYALNKLNKNYLLNKSNEEIFNELLLYFTNNGSSKEDSLALDALSLSMKNLEILDLEDLGNINEEEFLKEVLSTFVELNFEFRFYEKISKSKKVKEVQAIINEMKGYLRGTIYEELTFEKISEINFEDLSGEQYIIELCNDALTLFEDLYEE